MIDAPDIAAIEARAAAAWPATRSIAIGDWLVRLSDGYTRRANAASAIGAGARLDTALPAIEAAYAAHGRPPQFRLTPLADATCDALLARSGYMVADPSVVMIADGPAIADGRVAIASAPDAAWLALSAAIAGHDEGEAAAQAALLARIAPRTGFATVIDGDEPVGVGVGVVQDGMIGLFALAVAPGCRGRGHGRALTDGLRVWGTGIGATTAWLQVADTNRSAVSLYANMGFVPAYRYHYRVAAALPPA